jgi:hypothetical protein
MLILTAPAFAQEKEENEGSGSGFLSTDSVVSFRYMAGEESVAAPLYPEGFSGFSDPMFQLLNQFGSFGFRNNGLKIATQSDRWDFYSSYFYQNYDGYLDHSQSSWNVAEIGIRAKPSTRSSLFVRGGLLQRNGEASWFAYPQRIPGQSLPG